MLKLFKKTPLIEFYCREEDFGVLPEPYEAKKNVPEWFKKIPPTLGKDKIQPDMFGQPTMTAKKCLPLLDAMTLGWIIPLWADVQIIASEDGRFIEPTGQPNGVVVQTHLNEQVGGETAYQKTLGGVGQPLKFINKWFIKTAPGYSCLFVPPINNLGTGINKHFTCISGFVDTDVFFREINFPAVWHTPGVDITVPAHTPLVQVIPIHRSLLDNEAVIRPMSEEEKKKTDVTGRIQGTRAHYYT
jgi:hypothetical protein